MAGEARLVRPGVAPRCSLQVDEGDRAAGTLAPACCHCKHWSMGCDAGFIALAAQRACPPDGAVHLGHHLVLQRDVREVNQIVGSVACATCQGSRDGQSVPRAQPLAWSPHATAAAPPPVPQAHRC